MKILRAIGGFFAKIGRWIANTAWIQPLLIVGGIFAIIFSIPYIKKAFEKDPDTTDYNYEYYTSDDKLLTGDKVNLLFSYLAEGNGLKGNQGAIDKIAQAFGTKFFITFIEQDSECSSQVGAWQFLNDNWSNAAWWGESYAGHGMFKLYTVLCGARDTTDKVKYIKKIANLENNKNFFDTMTEAFGEGGELSYPLYKNLINDGNQTKVESLQSSITTLCKEGTDTTNDNFQTPFTMMFDYSKTISNDDAFHVRGITAMFFGITDIMKDSEKNYATKAQTLRDCWSYQGIFEDKK